MGGLKEFQKKVIANAGGARGLPAGSAAPDFILPDADKQQVSLSGCLKRGPVVLKFYRGSWCPICNRDLRSLQDILPQIKSLGASLLAVSPQNPDMAMDAKEKNSLEFRVLSDANQEVIRKYNLQFDPGEDYLKRRDLRLLNGDGSIFLPVPATFVIDRQAVIRAAHIDPNYTLRMKPEAILAALSDILENPGG